MQRQLKRIGRAIQEVEATQRSGPIACEYDLRKCISHLYVIRDGLRRELGIAPTAAERRELQSQTPDIGGPSG